MILCCGEALIDMLPGASQDGMAAFVPVPGGAIFNTAISLGRLNQPVGLFTGLSNDLFGTQLVEALQRSNVDFSLAARSERPTTLAFVKLTDGTAEYAFYDENTAGRLLSEADMPSIPDEVSSLLFGAISLISEPAGSLYEALALRESEKRVIVLDPNIRPNFITQPSSHRARMGRLIAASDIVKVSDEDLDWLEQGTTVDETVEQWFAQGVSLVLLTMGSDGARALTADLDIQVPGSSTIVVDTVGAGDTFNAGVLASLRTSGVLSKQGLKNLTEEVLKEALTLGCRVAGVTVSRAGANPPYSHELR